MSRKMRMVTLLIVGGILVAYINQMAPSPLLGEIRNMYGIGSDAVLNLSISIINPTIIISSLLGARVERKLGTARLYSFTLLFLTIGMLMNYIAGSYIVFLAGRVIFGFGFGLGIPFIGSAIMQWYDGKRQEKMNTLNGIFPYVGTVISMGLFSLLYKVFKNSVGMTLGIWGLLTFVILILWTGQKSLVEPGSFPADEGGKIYSKLWKRRDIRLLCGAFFFDFFCYQYIATVLPTFYMEAGGLSAEAAGSAAAIAFPAVGIFGAGIGGAVMSVSGRRKPSMVIGQAAKFIGVAVLAFGTANSFCIMLIGTAIYALGNSMWMPGMYMTCMEQEAMTPNLAGAAFALISACGFAAGAISPVLGGVITDLVAGEAHVSMARHAEGLKLSLLLFNITNLFGLFCISRLKETGKRSVR